MIETVKNICQSIGFIPQRSSGQNFLFNKTVIKKIADASDLSRGDTVLEIGPGLGFLTAEILKRAGMVFAVELDKRLAQYLKKEFAHSSNLKIIHQDIFKTDLKNILPEKKYKLVANLPYNITSLVLRNFLSLPPRPSQIIVTVQKEVAERICAKPGQMSLLSVMCQIYSDPEILFTVKPDNFWPAPKIDSAVICLKNIAQKNIPPESPLFRFIRAGFSAKRKKLSNNLKNSLNISPQQSEKCLKTLNLSLNIRAQELSVGQWLDLFKKLFDVSGKM